MCITAMIYFIGGVNTAYAIEITIRQTNFGGEIIYHAKDISLREDWIKNEDLYLSFNQPIDNNILQLIPEKLPSLIKNVEYAYDSVLFVLQPNVLYVISYQTNGITLKLLSNSSNNQLLEAKNKGTEVKLQSRLSYLEALTQLKLGKTQLARENLTRLVNANSSNSEYQHSLAQLELTMGDWQGALSRYNYLLKNDPSNPDIKEARVAIFKTFGDNFSANSRFQKLAQSTSLWQNTLRVKHNYHKHWSLFFKMDSRKMQIDNVQYPDGEIKEFNSAKGFVDIGLKNNYPNYGLQYTGYFSENNIGAKFVTYAGAPNSRINFGVSYSEPFLDYPEAIVGNATSNKLHLGYNYRFATDIFTQYRLSVRQYNIDDLSDTSRSVQLNVDVKIPMVFSQYQLYAAYHLEVESVGEHKKQIKRNGEIYTPLLILDREVHQLEILIKRTIKKKWTFHASTGYIFDRLNSQAPFFSFSFTYSVLSAFEVGVNLYNSLAYERGSNQRVKEVGIFTHYYFF